MEKTPTNNSSVGAIRYSALNRVLGEQINQLLDIAMVASKGNISDSHLKRMDEFAEKIDEWIIQRTQNEEVYIKRYGGPDRYKLIIGTLQNQLELLEIVRSSVSGKSLSRIRRFLIMRKIKKLIYLSRKLVKTATIGTQSPELDSLTLKVGFALVPIYSLIIYILQHRYGVIDVDTRVEDLYSVFLIYGNILTTLALRNPKAINEKMIGKANELLLILRSRDAKSAD